VITGTGYQLKCSQYKIENEVEFNRDTLQPILARIKEGMGCDDGAGLIAEPYKLLVYTEGCFFRKHQDTERTPRMFGTLIVLLRGMCMKCHGCVWVHLHVTCMFL
jgi:hypothetical protein